MDLSLPVKAIFLDKDGTLIHDVPYNTNPAKIKLINGAVETLSELALYDYKFVVISNQQGIANGKITVTQFNVLIDRLIHLLSEHNIKLLDFYYCPHDHHGSIAKYAISCHCRKPLPGLIFKAAEDHNIDLGKSWVIGDILHDIEAGNRAGCKTILLDNGNETEWLNGAYRIPDFTVTGWEEISTIVKTRVDESPKLIEPR